MEVLIRRMASATPADRTVLDNLVLWGFGALFLVEALLIVANIFDVPTIWFLGDEGSLPTYLHSGILFGVALVFLYIFGVGLRHRRQLAETIGYPPVWLFGALSFIYLSLDEALELHERGSRLVFEELGIQNRIIHYELTPALWEVVLAPIFVGIGLLILWVLFQQRRGSETAFRLGLSAIGLWALALITEFFEMTYFIHMGSVGPFTWFGIAIWVEETSEILASTFLLAAALLIIGRIMGWSNLGRAKLT